MAPNDQHNHRPQLISDMVGAKPDHKTDANQPSTPTVQPPEPVTIPPRLAYERRYSSRRPHIKKRRQIRRYVILGIALLVVGGIAAIFWDMGQLYHKINHLQVGNLKASVGGTENILIAGSTNRCNLKVQNAQWGFCSQGVTGVNSDVIIIAHLVPSTGSISLLSIPRDTFVPNARSNAQAFKIDAALYQGPSQLVNAVEEDFGIPIQHYVEVGFDGFVNIVNAVGGIKMYFPMPVFDSESHLKILTPGCKLLNGVEALQVVRARHLQYKSASVTTNDYYYWPQETQSDIARIARSHEFLKLLGSEVLAKGLGNPITDQKLVDAMAPQVQVDSGLNVSTMLSLAKAFEHVNPNNIKQYVMPVSVTGFGSYSYDGYNYGDVVFPVQPNDRSAIDQFLGISQSTNPFNDKPLPQPQNVHVSVVNGSGLANQAADISNSLSNLGFQIAGQPQSVTPASTQAQETYVYYASSATEPDAMTVANNLSGYVILAEDPGQVTAGAQVTIQTGTATAVISKATSTASASPPPSSPSPPASDIAAPISDVQQLAPWDPRACPAGK